MLAVIYFSLFGWFVSLRVFTICQFAIRLFLYGTLLHLLLQHCSLAGSPKAVDLHMMCVFVEELQLCAKGEGPIHNRGVRSQSIGGFLGLSTSHRDNNRSLPGFYFQFHCIIITDFDRICGSDTQEELCAVRPCFAMVLHS